MMLNKKELFVAINMKKVLSLKKETKQSVFKSFMQSSYLHQSTAQSLIACMHTG